MVARPRQSSVATYTVPKWYLNSADQDGFAWYRLDEANAVSDCWKVTKEPPWF
jgi:hypothetical protein